MLTTALGLPALTVLVVSLDRDLVQTVQRALASVGDRTAVATDLTDALAVATTEDPTLAFVDITPSTDAGLALVHHLLAVRPEMVVYVLAPPLRLEAALEALTLGAAGMLTLPTSGDAVLRAHGEVRTRVGAAVIQARLEDEVRLLRQRADAMQRIAKLLPRATRSEIAATTAESLREIAGAGQVALYAADSPERASLLGATAADAFPREARVDELTAMVAPDGESLSLAGVGRVGGLALFDRVLPPRRGATLELLAFAGSVLTLPSEGAPDVAVSAPPLPRFEALDRFETTLAREIEKARRHRRPLSVVAFDAAEPLDDGGGALEDRLVALVRDCDVLGHDPAHDEALLLLPDTARLGAQLCRRRIGGGPAGIASFPVDGSSVEGLLAMARRRRAVARGSAVRALRLGTKGLRDVVQGLLGCPFVDAGVVSPYPLSLAIPSALSLVEHATLEALRTGATAVLTLASGGVGFASAVREATQAIPDVAQVVEAEVDLGPGPVLDAVVVLSDHGCWACCGVLERDRFSAVHAADPLLADLIARRLLDPPASAAPDTFRSRST